MVGHKIAFKWELSFGHIVQMASIFIGLVGIYYGLVMDIDRNRIVIAKNIENIRINAQSIRDIRESREAMLAQWRTEADKRENRTMDVIREIKENVNWLVRREADRRE